MLRFFHRIRKGLFDSGAVRKYLVYTIGEIMLVVIGILIALQINNWNQDKSSQQQIRIKLENLLEDFYKDRDNLQRVEIINAFRYHSIHHVLSANGISLDSLNPDIIRPDTAFLWEGTFPDPLTGEFVEASFTWIVRPRQMIRQSNAIEELNGTGLYSSIKNQKLKELVNEYYQEVEWRFGGDEIFVSREVLDLREYLITTHNILLTDLAQMPDPVRLIRNDQALIVRLRAVIADASWRTSGATRSLKRLNDAIQAIEEELGD